MAAFDYTAEAELFPSRTRMSRRQPIGYKRFTRAADAIRFAIEELPEEFLAGAYLEVNEERFNRHEIAQLYQSADYPLPRREQQAGAQPPVPASDAKGARDVTSDPSQKKIVRRQSS